MNIKTIGILGSGQLGRMIAIAAAEMGVRAHIFSPDTIGSPAAEVAHSATEADYTDEAALKKRLLDWRRAQTDAVAERPSNQEKK